VKGDGLDARGDAEAGLRAVEPEVVFRRRIEAGERCRNVGESGDAEGVGEIG
jgi:hypothetical protein